MLLRRALGAGLFAFASVATSLWSVSAVATEPWSDPDPPTPPTRAALGDFGFRGAAEMRVNGFEVNPVLLSSEVYRKVGWIEQRLRLGGTVDWKDTVRITTLMDALDGVLFGDNGTFGGSPSTNSGTTVNTKNPNLARPCVTYKSGDPLQSSAYGWGLCTVDPIHVRQAYGEVMLPFGMLRVGRQPVNIGVGVQANDGEGRTNRFGISHNGNTADRVLFATKPLEAFKRAGERDTASDRGLFLILAYDRIVQNDPQSFSDDTQQFDVALRFLAPKWKYGSEALIAAFYAHRWDYQYNTSVNATGVRAMSRLGDFHVGIDFAANVGSTREISAGYKFITNDPVVDQTVRAFAGRFVARYDRPLYSLYLEGDYASGNDDPRARQPLTQFTWAEDTHLGLLLFPQIIGLYSARAAAAGVETLKRLGAPTNPAEAVDTRGAVTNVLALFPQVDVTPNDSWLFRFGALFAWGATRVIDPIASLQNKRGPDIETALVNYAGGKPATFYGVELDARIRFRYLQHFNFDLEGAMFFQGAALQDQDGRAVRSGMVQGRTTFFF